MTEARHATNSARDQQSAQPAPDLQHARTATGDVLAALLHHDSPEVLHALLENPALNEEHLCALLGRRSLPQNVVESIASKREWLKSYRVKKALALHPHVPRLAARRLLKDLYLMDLVQIALLPGTSAELKHHAEDQLVARMPQLPLGQKITLARRGPARVAGSLLAEGHTQIISVALDNPYLTSTQILKALAREKIPERVVHAVSQHRKWSLDYNVRLALVRHPATTLSAILGYLPELTVADLEALASPGVVPDRLRKYLEAETLRRIQKSERIANSAPFSGDRPSKPG
jgi:hypothetical protein